MASFGSGYNPVASAAFRLAEKRPPRVTDVTVFVGDELRALYVDAGACREDDSMVIHSPIDVTRLAEAGNGRRPSGSTHVAGMAFHWTAVSSCGSAHSAAESVR